MSVTAMALLVPGPMRSADSEKAASELKDDDLFGSQPLHHFELSLDTPQMLNLRRDSRQYVPGQVRLDGRLFTRVGIHLKGNGSFHRLEDKPSLTLDFERFGPRQRGGSLHKVHLNNSVEDASYLREWIGSQLFAQAGVPAPRVAHALVRLNGRQLGLYVLKEGFTKEFLARHFEESDGRIYETQDGAQPAASTNNPASLQPLGRAAEECDLQKRWERLNSVLNVELFISMLAMEVITCHWDGYALGRNNFRLYESSPGQKLVFLPTGMDQLFANPRLTWKPPMAGPIARALLETPPGQQCYRDRLQWLAASAFNPAQLIDQIHHQVARLRPYLPGEPSSQVEQAVSELCLQIAQRQDYLRAELGRAELGLVAIPPAGLQLLGWKPLDHPDSAILAMEPAPDCRRALHSVGGPLATWQTLLRLPRGHYRFQGLACTRDVTPLPYGKNHGAHLRVATIDSAASGLIGTRDWQQLQVEFFVPQPEAEIAVICELRASRGEAWFAEESLLLKRIENPSGQVEQ